MLTICLPFFSSLKEVTCRTKNCCVLHTKLCCVYVRHLNYVWFIKNTLWLQKIIWHSKDWLNMFSVAQKRNTCWQKIVVPVVYKCILSVHWLGEFCIARKMFFDVVQKLKLVFINVNNFLTMALHIRPHHTCLKEFKSSLKSIFSNIRKSFKNLYLPGDLLFCISK